MKYWTKVQIMHRRNHYPQQLSGGQQQRGSSKGCSKQTQTDPGG